MRLLRQVVHKNSLIQVYACPTGFQFEDLRVFLDRVDVTDYACVEGGPSECVVRAKEIIDHYSRQIPTLAASASAELPAR